MFPSLRQVFPTKRNAEADRTTTYTSNVTSAPTHTLTGRDPDETEFSPTDALAVAENCSSKRPSSKFKFSLILICVNFVSILPDLC